MNAKVVLDRGWPVASAVYNSATRKGLADYFTPIVIVRSSPAGRPTRLDETGGCRDPRPRGRGPRRAADARILRAAARELLPNSIVEREKAPTFDARSRLRASRSRRRRRSFVLGTTSSLPERAGLERARSCVNSEFPAPPPYL